MSKKDQIQPTDQFQFPVKFKSIPQGDVFAPINGGVLIDEDAMGDFNSLGYHFYVNAIEKMAFVQYLKKIGHWEKFSRWFSWDHA